MSSNADGTVKGVRKLASANSVVNAVSFLVEQKIRDMVNTSDIVRVDSADQPGSDGAAGFGCATPLVTQIDAYNDAVQPASLQHLRAWRHQAGECAIVLDPQPGDKCLAVFQKRDSSVVTEDTAEPVQPGSFRSFDQADGVLFPSVQGKAPKAWLKMTPDHAIEVSTDSASVTIEIRESGNISISTASGSVTVKASEKITLDAPLVEVTGHIQQTGTASSSASSFSGGLSNSGGTISSNGVTLETHTHGGVQTGSGSTGAPN